jgi:energy-coupling factor transport system ATP-binding protein
METLRALNIAGRTIIIVTHDTRVVAEYARRAIVMADGRIIADGSPSDIFYDREAMKRAALRPPPIVELAALMTPSGAPASGILTVDEFTDCLHLARRVAS